MQCNCHSKSASFLHPGVIHCNPFTFVCTNKSLMAKDFNK